MDFPQKASSAESMSIACRHRVLLHIYLYSTRMHARYYQPYSNLTDPLACVRVRHLYFWYLQLVFMDETLQKYQFTE